MDKIVKSLLDDFVKTQNLETLELAESFVYFASYCTLSREVPETIQISDVITDGGDDGGIDGFALVVNGTLVTDKEELEDIARSSKYLEATFSFVQAKTSENFDGGEIGTFLFGVREFFNESRKMRFSETLKNAISLSDLLYKKAPKMTRGNPSLRLYYVTTGKWQDDQTLKARLEVEQTTLLGTNLFQEVKIYPIDAITLAKLYRETRNRVEVEVNFPQKVTLPDINGIQQAFLGVLDVTEYLRLITDEVGNIRKSLFYENVRDYQGDNDVNREISHTLTSEKRDRFCVLNNGVTIVAREVQQTGTKVKLSEFQIVNGCQTSHVLHAERAKLTADVHIPVKIIATDNEEVAAMITKATNRQTALRPEQLFAIEEFPKRIEAFFQAHKEKKEQLFYERRSKQYSDDDAIEKTRIVTMQQLVSSFTAMFLNKPHEVSRSFGKLLGGIGRDVFAKNHKLEPYLVSGLANHRLEYLFRRKLISPTLKIARYPILFSFRVLAGGGADKSPPSMSANSMVKYANSIKNCITGEDAEDTFKEASSMVQSVIKEQQSQFKRTTDMMRSPDFTRGLKKKLGFTAS